MVFRRITLPNIFHPSMRIAILESIQTFDLEESFYYDMDSPSVTLMRVPM